MHRWGHSRLFSPSFPWVSARRAPFSLEWKNRKLPRGSQQRCQRNKRAGHSHKPAGDKPWEEGPSAQGRHRASSVPGPRGHSAPCWFCLGGDTKAAPVWEEWLGHLIGGSRSSFHTQREMHRGCSPGTSQPLSCIRWGQLWQAWLSHYQFGSIPSQPRRVLLWPPGGSHLGLTSQAGFPRAQAALHRLHPSFRCPTIYKVQNSNSFPSMQQNRGPCRSGVPCHVGSNVMS